MKNFKADKRGGSVSLNNSGAYRLRGASTSQCIEVVKRIGTGRSTGTGTGIGTGTGTGTAPLSQSLGGRSRILFDKEAFTDGTIVATV